jgi:phospholipase/carboxylesterase
VLRIADLMTLSAGHLDAQGRVVVLLHGYDMSAGDLAPFGESLGVPGLFLFPQAPLQVSGPGGVGHAWWPVDMVRRAWALRAGPRDLAEENPHGMQQARALLLHFLAEVRERFQPRQLVLGGFSQGGMLACDGVLRGAGGISSLVLLSSSCIALADWQRQRSKLRDLPVFVSHGRQDANLAFAAGERLRDFALEAGAAVRWTPFDGGHEIPLAVWRSLRAFLRAKSPSGAGASS